MGFRGRSGAKSRVSEASRRSGGLIAFGDESPSGQFSSREPPSRMGGTGVRLRAALDATLMASQ
jgi:hypothetical protein